MFPKLLGKADSQSCRVPGAGDSGLPCLGQLLGVGKESWGAAGGGWVGKGASVSPCDAAQKEGRLLGGGGLLPKAA